MNGFEGELRERLLSLERPGPRDRPGIARARRRARAARAPAAPARRGRGRALHRADRRWRCICRRCCRWCCAASIPRLESAVADVRPLLVEGELRCAAAGQQRRDPRTRYRRSARRARRRSRDAAGAHGRRPTACPSRACASSRVGGVFAGRVSRITTTRWCWRTSTTCARSRRRRSGRQRSAAAFHRCAAGRDSYMPAVRAAVGRRLHHAATGPRTTPATFAPSASRRP